MAAKNKVIAGDYVKCNVELSWGAVIIKKGFSKIKLTKETVEEYEVADQDSIKSGKSGLIRISILGTRLLPKCRECILVAGILSLRVISSALLLNIGRLLRTICCLTRFMRDL